MMLFILTLGNAQQNLSFDGQLSAITSYSPQVEKPFFAGLRYIPELNYGIQIDTFSNFNFEASANINGVWNEGVTDGNISPYRLWARYTGKQFEIRAGLQKIEFGSASILRPLQWFNQVDPRDPLQLTNGVYALLGRYYFLNNANIWVWGLYGNEGARGFDPIHSNKSIPEYGGRVQFPVTKGELGLTYHHRVADSRALEYLPSIDRIPENRIGLDGKWDVGVGLWFEAAHLWRTEMIAVFKNQTTINVGVDYTFGLGNGLAFIAEHMILSYDEEAFTFGDPVNFTAATMAYPLTFFDNIGSVIFYNWNTTDVTFILNYEHQFNKVSMYVMAYYNPSTTSGIQDNDLVYSFAGPGIRLMAVYNH
nr:hypothetical protein [Portibacter lacus]